jgi:hypothetical protein
MRRNNHNPKPMHLRALLAALLCATVGGCSLVGGSEGLKHSENYRVTPPKGWNRTSKKDSDYAFTTAAGSIVTVVSSCDHRSQAPLEVLSNHLLIGSRNRKIHKRGAETIGAVSGSWTQAQVEVENVTIDLAFFVTKAETCVFDFSLMKRNAIPGEDVSAFRDFIATFSYGKD